MRVQSRLGGAMALVLGMAGFTAIPAGADVLSDNFYTVREGNSDNALVGFSVGTAGDVNGDGFSDVLLNGGENNGTVWCYHGGSALDFTTPAWFVGGGGQNWLGSKVSTAGDVNGDGYDDVMVGAPVYWNEEFGEGALYVYLGSGSGLSTTPQILIESNMTNIGFGGSVDTAGDVNGDGFDDIVVGASRYADGQSSEGRAYLFLGSPSGIPATPAWTFESNVEFANLGSRVCGTGDVNADGFDDILVAAPELSNGQTTEGRVYLFLGSASGLPASPSWTYESNVTGGRCGWGLGFAGDINGDGYSDITFDTGTNNPSTGAVLVFLGGSSGPGASADRTFPSNHGGFGDILYTAGDLNGDGFAELVASEPTLNTNTGAITILGGWESGPLPVLAVRNGQQAGEQFGADARPAGDVNGDGFSDLIVGAPRFDNGNLDEGIVRLYLGRPSLPGGPSILRDGTQDNAMFGYSIAQGDWNGDGRSDLAVGIPYYDATLTDRGAVKVYYGRETGYSANGDWFLTGSLEQEACGYTVANAGDVDNDGYDELLVAEPFWGEPGLEVAGRALMFEGSPDGLEGAASWTGKGEALGAFYGMGLSGAGDVNGDGYGDVVVGAPSHKKNGELGGKAYLYLGSAAGLSDVHSWSMHGGADFAEFGRSVAGAGDVNGDGYADIVVGAPRQGAVPDEGYVHVFFGSSDGPSATWNTHGNQISGHYGAKVAAAGDVNGDGYSDIIVGAPDYDSTGGVDCGIATVFLGNPGNTLVNNWQRSGWQLGDRYGFGLGGGGDVNNDGYSDIVIGAPWMNGASSDGGGLFLHLGGPAGTSFEPAWMHFDTDDWSNIGYSVNISGDVTGDGFADVVAGQPFAGTPTGRIVCFYGGREIFPYADNGALRLPRQFRTDGTTPVALAGTSDAGDGFVLSAVGRSAFGRSDVQLEWQASPVGTSWTDAPQLGSGIFDTGAPIAGAGSAIVASTTVTGLSPDTKYHWRVRFRGHSPFFPTTAWVSMPANGGTETDLRTGAGVTNVDDLDGDAESLGGLYFSRVTPNPSQVETTLRFVSPTAGEARLTIHDVSGRRIATLLDGLTPAGAQSVQWNLRDESAREVPTGVYLARLTQGSEVTTTKLVVRR